MPYPSSEPCPSDDELVGLVEGRLDAAALARLREHAVGCGACAGVLAGLGSAEVRAMRPSTTGIDVPWARDAVAEESASTHGRIFTRPVLVPVGSRIADRFVIAAYAGAGGMGTVYRARDEQTGGMVALKLLQRSDSPQDGERFAREANLLEELRHPGIVEYLAHGVTEAGQPYLAMEWLEGEDLAERLARGPLPLPEALVLLRRAAEALAVAHARGVVHRDLKPSNLFLREGRAERLALLDFGIARRGSTAQMITGTGLVVGTPAYMAPEQARGERYLSPAADVFSLGCVMFECLTGQRLFTADQLIGVLAKVLFEEPPRLCVLRPEMPEGVEALLARMLAKGTGDRLPDAEALLAALDAPDDVRVSSAAAPERAGEQQLLSVLMATPLCDLGAETLTLERVEAPIVRLGGLSSTVTKEDAGQVQDLARVLTEQGARVEVLANGSLVATLRHAQGAATDQAAQAARCALLIKDRWPGVTIALGTGPGLWHERAPAGEVFDRAAALLRDHASLPALHRPAPPSGQILLDEVTGGLLEMRFVVRRTPTGAHTLTGEELALDASRPLLGKPTPCVGREAELGMLEAAVSSCFDEGEPRAILVTAPPGVGKSRLWHELSRRLAARGADVSIWIGRAEPMSTGTSYALLGQALRRLAGIMDGAGLEARRAKLARRVGEHLPDAERERVVAFVGELSGVPFPDEGDAKLRAARQDPQLMGDQITRAMLDFLRAECKARPTLLVLEDLHWSDALTVKMVEVALHALEDCPLMVLALARPEINALFPRLWAGAAKALPLQPLSKKAGERLVQHVLGKQVAPETVLRILACAEGNALFLEELIRAVAESRGDETPETVLAMMQARIGRLPAGARRVLRAASVFGETAWVGGIRALVGGWMTDQEIDDSLTLLLEEEILEERRESRFPGEKAYRFRHAVMRDACYSLSSEEERVAWHRLAAEYLEVRGEPDSLVLAEHFVQGREPLRAAPHYLTAGEESYEANDMAATLSSAKRGRACGATGELRGALLSLEIAAFMWRDPFAEVIALGTEAIELLPDGTKRWCRSLRCVCVAAATTGQMALLAELGPRFARVEPSADARGEYIQGATWFAIMFARAGMKEASRAFRERARQTGATTGRDDLLTWGYLIAMEAADHFLIEEVPWSSMTRLTEAADALRAVGEHRYRLVVCSDRGKELHDVGDLTGAEADLRETLAQAERLGEALPLTYAKTYLARLLAQVAPIDRLDEPEALARDVVAAKNASLVGTAYGTLAEIRLRQGDLVDAEREARAGCEAARPFPSNAGEVIGVHARILLEQGRAAEALAVAEAGVLELERLGLEGSGEIELRLSLAEALHALGRTDAARTTLVDLIPRLKKRVDDIPEPAARERYLTNVPANARVVALAKAWLGEEAVRTLGA